MIKGIDTHIEEYLTVHRICDRVSGWKKYDTWLCGLSNFATRLIEYFGVWNLLYFLYQSKGLLWFM